MLNLLLLNKPPPAMGSSFELANPRVEVADLAKIQSRQTPARRWRDTPPFFTGDGRLGSPM